MCLRHRILIIAILCIGAGLRLANVKTVTVFTPDENVYTYQATTWMQSGEAGMRHLVQEYKTDPEMRFYPPPTRVGMIRLVAAAIRITGVKDARAGERLACAAGIGSLLLVALISLRFLPVWAATAALLFYAVLPAELAIARRTWTDAPLEFAALLLIWCACEIARGSERRRWCFVFALAGGAGLLIKETMLVPWGVCVVWILWVLALRRRWEQAVILISTTGAAVFLGLWWLSQQVGSLGDLVGIIAGIPAANAANPYAIEYASGPPWLMLFAFWLVAPLASLLSLAGIVAVWKDRSAQLVGLAAFVGVHVAIAMAIPHWINLRYVGVTFGPFCMLAGLGCRYLVSAAGSRRWVAGLVALVLLASAVGDYYRFQRIFVDWGMGDESIKDLLDARGTPDFSSSEPKP